MTTDQAILAAIERKIDDYHGRYLSPTPATIAKWRREEIRKRDLKNQLALPLDYREPPTPTQTTIFDD